MSHANLSALLQRFLGEHQQGYPGPLYDQLGHYLFAAPEKVQVLTRAILHALAKGRDNQMPTFKTLLGEGKVHVLAAYVWSLSNTTAVKVAAEK